MRSLLPLAVYCISLVSLLAVALEGGPDSPRLDLLNIDQREDKTSPSGSQSNIAIPSSSPSQFPKRLPGFLAFPTLAWARPREASQIKEKMPRVRRNAHSGLRGGHRYPHHAQLMRVGCVLGTCQVQNLSHRLYQLIGQSGREDSSPINPRSPHSYG
uniref:Adrenomedullin 2b n=1 Tax=Monopterus albus TaxID=43700 RepID=A0A3Q3JHD4_MONAL|nr:ADM2-like [Monopterus albus]